MANADRLWERYARLKAGVDPGGVGLWVLGGPNEASGAPALEMSRAETEQNLHSVEHGHA